MDIQISSNFERLLFELYDRDGRTIGHLMQRFREDGRFEIEPARWRSALRVFDAERFDDEQTKAVIRAVYAETGNLLDPHSAIGVAAARAHHRKGGAPVISLATAHPAKFPDAVKAATGVHPKLPARLADLFEREELYEVLPADLGIVKEAISTSLHRQRENA
jgi:threonine synthase